LNRSSIVHVDVVLFTVPEQWKRLLPLFGFIVVSTNSCPYADSTEK
jgi:hypothetical protein